MAIAVDLMGKPIKTRANPRIFAAAILTLPKVKNGNLRSTVSRISRFLAVQSAIENARGFEENITLYSNGCVRAGKAASMQKQNMYNMVKIVN